MGQDSLNLQYGKMHSAKYRKGVSVDMHPDEGYGGPKMIPGYAGAYKNSKAKVLKANGNPKSFGPESPKKSLKSAKENGEMKRTAPKKRK
jgi:hypothetical protein